MTGGALGRPSFVNFRLSVSVWLSFWIQLLLFAITTASEWLPSEEPPRAVFVALAHEQDLEPVLSSIYHLEDTFNNRYRYGWVFFSTAPLSDEFRRRTSNATAAVCMYEVVQDDDLKDPGPVSNGDDKRDAALPGRLRHWKAGRFANEKRLRDYDWFWRIEPGAQFVHDLPFDIFRLMRDHGIAYGSSKTGPDDGHVHVTSPHVHAFIEDTISLSHPEAGMPWLLDAMCHQDDLAEGAEAECIEQVNGHLWETVVEVLPDSVEGTTSMPMSGDERLDGADMSETSCPLEAMTLWLSGLYKGRLTPAFEIGSLAFLRSQGHQALLEHLDKAGGLYSGGPREASTPTISAKIFLPQKSVLRLRKRERRCPSPPDATPEPDLDLDLFALGGGSGTAAKRVASRAQQRGAKDPGETMAGLFAFWELVVQDFWQARRYAGPPIGKHGH
ncbi:hypothetical protein ACCO45_004383 [Purpureocillium lilacinum]|uniref:Uncharacterized protein n=1 Tax=Purpureocillium lilacinum TaxID=33203 RepID=A0ACC4E2K4_PURLI